MQDALKLAEEALEKLLPWALQAGANAEDAISSIRAARAELGWRPIAEWPSIMRGVLHLGDWVEGHGWVTMKSETYSRGMAENGGWTHFYIEPQLPPPPAREEVRNG